MHLTFEQFAFLSCADAIVSRQQGSHGDRAFLEDVMLRLNEVIMGCLFCWGCRLARVVQPRTMSSGSVIFHNPAGLFTTTGMQKYPVRQDLKWQKHIYSQFAPLLPSSICLTGKVPPVLEGKSQNFKLLSDLNIESRAGWTGSTGLPVIDRWYSRWRSLFSPTTRVHIWHQVTSVQHPSREPNELKGAAIVKMIGWRHGGLRLTFCRVIRCPAILNLKDLGLDVASAEFSCFVF